MEPSANAKVTELGSSTIWFDEYGIMYSVSKKNASPVTLEDAHKNIAEFKAITKGNKVCMLSDATNSRPPTKELRDYYATELPAIIKAIAIISRSPLGIMVANLFFSIKKQPYPVRFFENEQEAKEWLMSYLHEKETA